MQWESERGAMGEQQKCGGGAKEKRRKSEGKAKEKQQRCCQGAEEERKKSGGKAKEKQQRCCRGAAEVLRRCCGGAEETVLRAEREKKGEKSLHISAFFRTFAPFLTKRDRTG